MPHKYNPDFTHPSNENVIIEVKGFFRTSAEAAKYVHVKSCNPEKEIIFIFSNYNKKCHGNCRVRKDGTIMTQAEWAEKHEFLYYSVDEAAKEEWLCEGRLTDSNIKAARKRLGYVDN